MKAYQIRSAVFGLALGLATAVNAQSGVVTTAPTGEIKGTEPLILDLSRFQKEKFVRQEISVAIYHISIFCFAKKINDRGWACRFHEITDCFKSFLMVFWKSYPECDDMFHAKRKRA